MLSDAQLACLFIAVGPMIVGAIWSLGDLAGHVATFTPAPQPGDALRTLAGHALRLAVLVPAVVTGVLALLFGRRVRP